MDIELIRDPEVVILRNCFKPEISKEILNEILKSSHLFEKATIGKDGQTIFDNNVRTNTACFWDEIHGFDPKKSVLLKHLYKKFKEHELHAAVWTMNGTLKDWALTNGSEIQVSRYGDKGQKYEWHHDNVGHELQRMCTLVYYVFKEPKQFEGGDILFTNGVVTRGKLIDQKPEPKIVRVKAENNMAVLFSSKIGHKVEPTTSPINFDAGRFSINCWLGLKQ